MANNNVVLICGEASTGKSASFRNMPNQEGVLYLNCENNKPLPFKNKFKEATVTDPMTIFDYFNEANARDDIHTIIVDSLTFLMSMFETKYIVDAKNGMAAWGAYQQYFKRLMNDYVAQSNKRIIFTAHVATNINEDMRQAVTQVPVKGALKDLSIEAFFTTVVMARKVTIKELETLEPTELLTITPQEEALGYKHVFQVAPTKETSHYRVRGPMGLFDNNVIYINNDAELLLNQITNYYGE